MDHMDQYHHIFGFSFDFWGETETYLHEKKKAARYDRGLRYPAAAIHYPRVRRDQSVIMKCCINQRWPVPVCDSVLVMWQCGHPAWRVTSASK